MNRPNSVVRNTNYIGKSNNGNDNSNAIYDDIRIYTGAYSDQSILNDFTTNTVNGSHSILSLFKF